MNRTKEITEAGLFAAITAVMIVGSFYIPIMGTVMGIFLPLPIIILTVKNKPSYAIAASAVAIITSGMIISFIGSVSLGGMAFMVGFPMGLAIKRKANNLITILVGTFCAAAGFAIYISVLQFMTDISLTLLIEENISTSMELQTSVNDIMKNVGVDATASIEETRKLMDEMIRIIKLNMPALMIASSMFYAAANLVLSHKVLKRLQVEVVPLGKFEEFRYPKHLAYGSMGMMLLAYIIGSLGYVDSELITANFANLFVIIFSVQGVSLLYCFFKKRVGKGVGIAIIVIFMMLGFNQVIAYLGFFDVLADLRKISINRKEQ